MESSRQTQSARKPRAEARASASAAARTVCAAVLACALSACAGLASSAKTAPDNFSQAAVDAAMQGAQQGAQKQGSWSALGGPSAEPDSVGEPIRVAAGVAWPLGSQEAVARAQREAGQAMASQEDGWQDKIAQIIAPLPADLQFKPQAQAAASCENGAQERPAAIIKLWTLRRGQTQPHSAAWRMDCAGDLPPPGVLADDRGEPLWLGQTRRARDERADAGQKAVGAKEAKARKGQKIPAETVPDAQGDEAAGQGVEIVQTASLSATGPAWMRAAWRTRALDGREGDWERGWFWFTPASSSLSSLGAANPRALLQWRPTDTEAYSAADGQ